MPLASLRSLTPPDVPTRIFYQHFPTKNVLVEAYLHRYEAEAPIPAEQ